MNKIFLKYQRCVMSQKMVPRFRKNDRAHRHVTSSLWRRYCAPILVSSICLFSATYSALDAAGNELTAYFADAVSGLPAVTVSEEVAAQIQGSYYRASYRCAG